MKVRVRSVYVIDVEPQESELFPGEEECDPEICQRVYRDLKLHGADSLYANRGEDYLVVSPA